MHTPAPNFRLPAGLNLTVVGEANTQLATVPAHRWTIPLQAVVEGTAELPQESREALLWLNEYGSINNLTTTELGTKLRKPNGACYSKDSVYQILTGRETSIANFISAVQSLRASVRPVIESPLEFPFVKTAISKVIWDYIELVRRWHKIGLIIGESQTGKTRAIQEYMKAHPEVDFLYDQFVVGAHKSKVVYRMCKLRGVSTKYGTEEREEALLESITPNTVIIGDEIEQCAARPLRGGRMGTERVDTIEMLRRIRDLRKCPLIFTGTAESMRMLRGDGEGHDSKDIFIKTLKRALDPCTLRNNPPLRDLDAFAEKVELKPAVKGSAAFELQRSTVIERGLEIWLTYLLAGAALAAEANRPVTWNDVLAGAATFKSGGGE